MKKRMSALDKKMEKIAIERSYESVRAELDRARSITVGTAFGGTTEINVRGDGGRFLWLIMQPVEVIEFINQLAAGIGCHIHIVPRQDFASWRDWKLSPEELAHFRGIQHYPGVGHAPHSSGIENHRHLAALLPNPKEQPGLNAKKANNETLATKKPKNRRSTKRATTPA